MRNATDVTKRASQERKRAFDAVTARVVRFCDPDGKPIEVDRPM